MPRPEKVRAVEEIRERLGEAKATFVTEYRGLSVAQQGQLRRSIADADGVYKVFKMSLARRAIEDMDLEGLPELLIGPTALAFAMSNPVPVARALRDFAKENERLVVKGGILAGALLKPEQVSRLADIESREVLLARIAGGGRAPLVRMAGLLAAKLREAASLFSQLLDKKESEPGPVFEEPAEPVVEPAAEEPGVAAEEPAAEAEPVVEAAAEEPAVAAEEPAAEAEPVVEAVAEEPAVEAEPAVVEAAGEEEAKPAAKKSKATPAASKTKPRTKPDAKPATTEDKE